MRSDEMNGAPPGTPTPAEIAQQTAKLREGWSEQKHRERAGIDPQQRWTPPETTAAPEAD